MSKKCCKKCPENYIVSVAPTNRNTNSCCCNFPTLVVLILIIYQFSGKKERNCEYEVEYSSKKHCSIVDNSILFLIALFFLCCNPCTQQFCG